MILGVKPRYGLKKSKPRASGDDPVIPLITAFLFW